ncbi:hypothetical protein MHBO_004046, partial [Bonamia ostreae]
MYTAMHLLRKFKFAQITLIDKNPMPFGLARFGVAPDNTDTKRVLNRFNDILLNPNCSFLGNVKFGKDIKIDFLQKYFDAVILAYGA